MTRPLITLTTDFGQADGYVAAMKGVILSLCPEARLVDISHDIAPQAIRSGAYVLSTAVSYFPGGAIHLVVVDPGVGSARRPVAVQSQRAFYVAPDNGVLTLALEQDPAQGAVHLTNPQFHQPQVSATFHGRDIFAPVAAHLACGVPLADLGTPLDPADLIRLPLSAPQRLADGSWQGEVLHIDRFGNLITNIGLPPSDPERLSVEARGTRIRGLSRTFADVEAGKPVAYVGSNGYLEIAVRQGNAAALLGLDLGDTVIVTVSP